MVKSIVINHERKRGEHDTKHNSYANEHGAPRLGPVPTTGEASNDDGDGTLPLILEPLDNGVGLDFAHVNVVGRLASPPALFNVWRLFLKE